MKKRNGINALLLVICLVVLTGCPGPTDSGDGKWADSDKTAEAAVYVIEAEDIADVNGCFAVFEDAEASGGRGLLVPEKGAVESDKEDPKPAGTATVGIQASKAMTVSVWFRVKWGGECANSFDTTLPGGMKHMVTGSTYHSWVWVQAVEKLPLPAGDSTLPISAREFDARIDQIAFIDNADYVPQGIETTNSNDKALLKLK